MTIREARLQLTGQLTALYPGREAALISDWVIEHLTGKKKTELLIDPKQSLSNEQDKKLAHYRQQLLEQRPVQYVLEEAWFGGMRFFVNEHVLIPRPETEELVDWVATDAVSAKTVLDVGTGSGCIPITLKKKMPEAAITSIDISEPALGVAAFNAKTLKADLLLKNMDFLDERQWPRLAVYDVIISNPPYISYTEQAMMEKHVTRFEPHFALFVPDAQPLVFYQKLAGFGKTHLSANGSMYVEINETMGKETKDLFERQGYAAELRKDLQGKDRMIRAKPFENEAPPPNY